VGPAQARPFQCTAGRSRDERRTQAARRHGQPQERQRRPRTPPRTRPRLAAAATHMGAGRPAARRMGTRPRASLGTAPWTVGNTSAPTSSTAGGADGGTWSASPSPQSSSRTVIAGALACRPLGQSASRQSALLLRPGVAEAWYRMVEACGPVIGGFDCGGCGCSALGGGVLGALRCAGRATGVVQPLKFVVRDNPGYGSHV
jgi:hypothetical protein